MVTNGISVTIRTRPTTAALKLGMCVMIAVNSKQDLE